MGIMLGVGACLIGKPLKFEFMGWYRAECGMKRRVIFTTLSVQCVAWGHLRCEM